MVETIVDDLLIVRRQRMSQIFRNQSDVLMLVVLSVFLFQIKTLEIEQSFFLF